MWSTPRYIQEKKTFKVCLELIGIFAYGVASLCILFVAFENRNIALGERVVAYFGSQTENTSEDCCVITANFSDTTLNGAMTVCDIPLHEFVIQSEERINDDVGETDQTEQHQTMGFNKPSDSTENYAAIYDSVTESIYSPDYELGNFLARPNRLYHFTFPVGAPFVTVNNSIWFDLINKTAIKRKVDNYNYLQATLKIKIVVNSTPFNYGMIGVTYTPLTGFTFIDSNSNNDICLSQRHTTFINLTESPTAEMEFPFFYYKNWLDITSASDVTAMGELKVWQIVQCATANAGVTSTPSMTIFGWFENVKLYGNTATLTLQSQESDGAMSGPVSSVASTIASAASYFENIPILGRFAKATRLGAGAVGSIANLFGFSNTPVIKDAVPYKSMPFHGFASSEISNVIEKLTLDPHNELSISPTTVGLPPIDELAIPNLVRRSAILGIPDWLTTDATNTLLFAANVTPTMCRINTATPSQTLLLDTPMGNVARLFSNWRGDICYHVKIVKTPYHKGTIRVQYDPKGGSTSVNDIENVVVTKIVDISETDEFIIRVPYMAPQSFLRVRPTLTTDYVVNAGSLTAYDDDFHNGRLTIKVVNNLTAPLDTASVKLVVKVYGGENLEFCNPSNLLQTTQGLPSPFVVQSEETQLSDDVPQDEVPTFEMGNCGQISPLNFDVHMGERIGSVRALLRRTHLVNIETVANNAAGNYHFRYEQTKYPPAYGYDPKGIHGAFQLNGGSTDVNFNFVWPGPFQWMQGCFIGMRGSTMWHYNAIQEVSIDSLKVTRLTEPIATNRTTVRNFTASVLGASYSNTSRIAVSRSRAGASGLALVNQKTQAGLSVLMPQYNKFKFIGASAVDNNFGRDLDDSINEKFWFEIVDQNVLGVYPAFERYFSVGPDFNFFYYVNCPPRYFYNVPTAAAF